MDHMQRCTEHEFVIKAEPGPIVYKFPRFKMNACYVIAFPFDIKSIKFSLNIEALSFTVCSVNKLSKSSREGAREGQHRRRSEGR